MRVLILLFILMLTSCSVKKNRSKLEKDIKTEVSSVTKVIRNDSLKYDSDTHEIVVEQKDSLIPVTIVLNGIESTFTNTRSITIRKKKESLRKQINEEIQIKKDSVNVIQENKQEIQKERTFDYKTLYPIGLVLILAFILSRIVKKFTFF